MEELCLLLDGLLFLESVNLLAVDMGNVSEAFFDNGDKFSVKK
jgi:hypothetical protein